MDLYSNKFTLEHILKAILVFNAENQHSTGDLRAKLGI